MALGKRLAERQEDLFVTADRLPRSPGHVFYQKLNRLLAEAGFDRWVEALCKPYYAEGCGRPGIPPGTYFPWLATAQRWKLRRPLWNLPAPHKAKRANHAGHTLVV